MSGDGRKSLGQRGEELAARHLAQTGLTVVARNWRCREGELDIVAQERAPDWTQGGMPATWLVAVEVRLRRGQRYGTARDAITPRKQAQLQRVAAVYIQEAGWQGPWRIDAVAIQLDGRGKLQEIEHIRHAVSA